MQILVVTVRVMSWEYFAELFFYIILKLLFPKLAKHVIDIDLIYGFNYVRASLSYTLFWVTAGKWFKYLLYVLNVSLILNFYV